MGAEVIKLENRAFIDGARQSLTGRRDGVRKLVDDAGATITHQAPLRVSAQKASRYNVVVPMSLQDVAPHSPLLRTALFGPIAPLVVWEADEELLDLVNGTDFRLASYIYGDLATATRTAERIEASMVGINRSFDFDPSAPFSGMKMSGIGREGGRFGLEEFPETQYISVPLDLTTSTTRATGNSSLPTVSGGAAV